MTNVFDIASYLLKKAEGPLEQMKLHKLLYYCQGWSLGNGRGPLFPEAIEAWVNGPVVPAIWAEHRYKYKVYEEPKGRIGQVSQQQRELIDQVWASYHALNGVELSRLTHAEQPWSDARRGLEPWLRSASEITQDALKDYFGKRVRLAKEPHS